MQEIEYKYYATCRNADGWKKEYEIRANLDEIKLLNQLQEYGAPVGILLWATCYDESFDEGTSWCSLFYNEKMFQDKELYHAGFLKVVYVEKVEIKKVKTINTIYDESKNS